jgi:cyclopropane fatty-acyl-phospholipid synthase-like methyltransferase
MKISKCRSCQSTKLVKCLDLGKQALTGIFLSNKNEKISFGNLCLVFCKRCTLLQLSENFNPNEMYGINYGYKSSLNPTMVSHLKAKANKLQEMAHLLSGDAVVDIGSNDGTFLSFFNKKYKLIGVDPTISKFKKDYKKNIIKIEDFFSGIVLSQHLVKKKAKLITSISMFYDLENPLSFAKEVYNNLDAEGLWHLEQSYMPSMIKNVSYDTICHEHLEYYSLKSIKYILDKANFKIIDIQLNKVNGGSFSLTVAKKNSKKFNKSKLINWILKKEKVFKFNDIDTIKSFSKDVYKHRKLFRELILSLNKMGKKVIGYGASTKGNVILQFCKIDKKMLSHIVDINPYKRNKYTPGSKIKIINEKDLKKIKFDYMVVLPWHFRDFVIEKEKNHLKKNHKLIFPLPDIEII